MTLNVPKAIGTVAIKQAQISNDFILQFIFGGIAVLPFSADLLMM